MKTLKIASALGVAAGLALTAPAFAESANKKLSQSECQALWSQADASGAGSLSQQQAQAYVSDFKSIDADANGKISGPEFLKGCQAGMVKGTASTGAGAGSSGASGNPPPDGAGSESPGRY